MQLFGQRNPEVGALTAFEVISEEDQLNSDLKNLRLGTATTGAAFFGAGLGVSFNRVGIGAALMAFGSALEVVALKVNHELNSPQE